MEEKVEETPAEEEGGDEARGSELRTLYRPFPGVALNPLPGTC